MKPSRLIIILSLFLTFSISGRAQTSDAIQKKQSQSVEVYYFHLTNRCVTCKAVENISRNTIEELYKGIVKFKVYNFQDKVNSEVIKSLGVKGQSIFIKKGDKKIDLTQEGFMYAKTKPEKFKAIIKENIDLLIQ